MSECWKLRGKYPDRLRVELNALATRVLFDETNRAIGIEYRKGERLYRAHARPSDQPGELRQIYASREVILAGGAFNSPQLLMLSGVGPRDVLESNNIPVRVELPGVGKNLAGSLRGRRGESDEGRLASLSGREI